MTLEQAKQGLKVERLNLRLACQTIAQKGLRIRLLEAQVEALRSACVQGIIDFDRVDYTGARDRIRAVLAATAPQPKEAKPRLVEIKSLNKEPRDA